MAETNKPPRKAFPFYASNLNALEQLPEPVRKKYALRIVEYGLSDTPIELTPEEEFLLGNVFEGIDNQKKRYRFQQRLEKVTAQVLAGPSIWRGLSPEEWKAAASGIKKLKARAHREVIENENLEIFRAVGKRVYNTLGLESPFVIDMLKMAIAKAPEERRARLKSCLHDILLEYYLSQGYNTMPAGVDDIPNI